jgi:hypothetical protein
MKRELIEIGTTIRIENGPARKDAIATKELLDDTVTKSHYAVGLRDALGKVIVLGESMTYLDYFGDWAWYVYVLEAVPIPMLDLLKIAGPPGLEVDGLDLRLAEWFGVDIAHVVKDPWAIMRFQPVDAFPTKEAALAAAAELED